MGAYCGDKLLKMLKDLAFFFLFQISSRGQICSVMCFPCRRESTKRSVRDRLCCFIQDESYHLFDHENQASLRHPHIWFDLIQDVELRRWYQWSNHFQTLTQQCQLVAWIQKQPSPHPSSALLVSYAFQHSEESTTQSRMALALLSCPPSQVSSSTFITALKETAGGAASSSLSDKPKTDETKKKKEVV